MIQLVDTNRANLDNLKLNFNKLIKKCGHFNSWANCIKFYREDTNNRVWDCHELDAQEYYINLIKNTSVRFLIVAYSNINPAVDLYIDVKEQTLTIAKLDSVGALSLLHMCLSKQLIDNLHRD